MKTLLHIAATLLSIALLSSCIYESQHPLPPPYEALPDLLSGKWQQLSADTADTSPMRLQIFSDQGQSYSKINLYIPSKEGGTIKWDSISVIAQQLRSIPGELQVVQLKIKKDSGEGYSYLIGKLEAAEASFSFQPLSESHFKDGEGHTIQMNNSEELLQKVTEILRAGIPFSKEEDLMHFEKVF